MERKEIDKSTMWVIVYKDGLPDPSTTSWHKKDIINNFLSENPTYTWKECKQLGYTVRKVKLTEIK